MYRHAIKINYLEAMNCYEITCKGKEGKEDCRDGIENG